MTAFLFCNDCNTFEHCNIVACTTLEALCESCEELFHQGCFNIHVFLLTFSWFLMFQLQFEDLMLIFI